MSTFDYYKSKHLQIYMKTEYDPIYINNVEVQGEMFEGVRPEYDSKLSAEENVVRYAQWANPQLWHKEGEDTVVFKDGQFLVQDYFYKDLILERLERMRCTIQDVDMITEIYRRRYRDY